MRNFLRFYMFSQHKIKFNNEIQVTNFSDHFLYITTFIGIIYGSFSMQTLVFMVALLNDVTIVRSSVFKKY